nr:hypothetical protein Q903MT_gene2967 [Picea sitchensis]
MLFGWNHLHTSHTNSVETQRPCRWKGLLAKLVQMMNASVAVQHLERIIVYKLIVGP